MKEWVYNLKPGDIVIIAGGYESRVGKVDRLTNTQVVVNNSKYRRDTGRRVGDHGYHTTYLEQATPERLEKVRHQQMVSELHLWSTSRERLNQLSTEQLEQILAIVKAA